MCQELFQLLMAKEVYFASQIQAQEVFQLLGAFLGGDNEIAKYRDPLISFEEAMTILDKATGMNNKVEGRAHVLDHLSDRTISVGMRCDEALIAHSALQVQPWAVVETRGSIVAEEYKQQSLMTQINERKRLLLEKFGRLEFLLNSAVILGSRSVDHGMTIFNFDDLHMQSYFVNFGPYVYERPIDHTWKDSAKLTDLALVTPHSIISTSSQILGLSTDHPPYVSSRLVSKVNPNTAALINGFPHTTVQKGDINKVEDNTVYYSPAKIAIRTLRQPFETSDELLEAIHEDVNRGMNVIARVPLDATSAVLTQLSDIEGREYEGVTLLPTGATVVNGVWAVTYASMTSDKLPHYRNLMSKIIEKYSGSLQKLARFTLNYLHSFPH